MSLLLYQSPNGFPMFRVVELDDLDLDCKPPRRVLRFEYAAKSDALGAPCWRELLLRGETPALAYHVPFRVFEDLIEAFATAITALEVERQRGAILDQHATPEAFLR
jgi:hypothetical protein